MITPTERLAAARYACEYVLGNCLAGDDHSGNLMVALEALIDAKLAARDAERSSRLKADDWYTPNPPGGDDGSATRKDAGNEPQGSSEIGSPLPPGTSMAGGSADSSLAARHEALRTALTHLRAKVFMARAAIAPEVAAAILSDEATRMFVADATDILAAYHEGDRT